MIPTVNIGQIANGYIVTVFGAADATGIAAPSVEQYCADKNAVATFLIAALVPGATYTPPPAP